MSENAVIEYAYGLRNKYTFKCKAIHNWIEYFYEFQAPENAIWLDPFHGQNPFEVHHANDIAVSGVDSHDWIKDIETRSIDGVFFDPPYSLERVKRSYDNAGIASWQKKYGNQSGVYPMLKDEIARVLKPGGICLSFGWNSVGMGSGRGFKKEHVMLVCHSGAARDTICTMERKLK